MSNFSSRGLLRAYGVVCVLTAGFVPCTAQAGFFDQLFGGGQPAQPSYSYEPQQPLSPDFGTPLHRPRVKRKVAIHDVPPVRQKTTDLMSDKTLHVGDAVMMKDGVHIYNGAAGKHTAKQFVPIDRSRDVSSKTRAALVAMDTTRNDPLQKGVPPDSIASGRSAAVATPISNGFKITDARGKSVRYVGP